MSLSAVESTTAAAREVRGIIGTSGELTMMLPTGAIDRTFGSPDEAERAAYREVRALSALTNRCWVLRLEKATVVCAEPRNCTGPISHVAPVGDSAFDRVLAGAAAALVRAHDLVMAEKSSAEDVAMATDLAEIALTVEELRTQRVDVELEQVASPVEAVSLALGWLECIAPAERPLWFGPLRSEVVSVRESLDSSE